MANMSRKRFIRLLPDLKGRTIALPAELASGEGSIEGIDYVDDSVSIHFEDTTLKSKCKANVSFMIDDVVFQIMDEVIMIFRAAGNQALIATIFPQAKVINLSRRRR